MKPKTLLSIVGKTVAVEDYQYAGMHNGSVKGKPFEYSRRHRTPSYLRKNKQK